jgi:hypothetical protein
MMKANDLRKETLIFYKQLHGAGLLSREAEDKILQSISRWPRRTRRSDLIDWSSFLLEILATVENLATESRKPGMSLWIQLVGELHVSARMDPALWRHIRSALYTILIPSSHSFGSVCLWRNLHW